MEGQPVAESPLAAGKEVDALPMEQSQTLGERLRRMLGRD